MTGVAFTAEEYLGRGTAGRSRETAHGKQNAVYVRRQTTIGGTGVHHVGPKLFVGQAMRTDNGNVGKFLANLLDFRKGKHLKVEHRDVGAGFQNGLTELIFLGESDGAALSTKIIDERGSCRGVVLGEYYVEGQHAGTPSLVDRKCRGSKPQRMSVILLR